jgi:hypothetical protein
MQVAGDKAAAILGVGGGVSSAGAGAGTIGVVKIGAKVGMAVDAEAGIATETIGVVGAGAEAGMAVGAEAGIATTKEIGRTGSIVGVFERFEVKVGSSDKS